MSGLSYPAAWIRLCNSAGGSLPPNAAEIGSPVALITKNTNVTRMKIVGMISKKRTIMKRKNPEESLLRFPFASFRPAAPPSGTSATVFPYRPCPASSPLLSCDTTPPYISALSCVFSAGCRNIRASCSHRLAARNMTSVQQPRRDVSTAEPLHADVRTSSPTHT